MLNQSAQVALDQVPLEPVEVPRAVDSPIPGGTGGPGGSPNKFSLVQFDDIAERQVSWLVVDFLPLRTATVLIGEEGIGKGLFSCYLVAKVTTGVNARNVILIATEDDPETTLKPRLRAAGADLSRVSFVTEDKESLSGIPQIPGDDDALVELITSVNAALVVIDTWLSVVPGNLQVKDTQQARRALDPINRISRLTECAILLVTHTNRSAAENARGRYGATVALRQAARLCLMAVADPKDPQVLYVGQEKANISQISPAVAFMKSGEDADWFLTEVENSSGLTIAQLLDFQQQSSDMRRTDRWSDVLKMVDTNRDVRRRDIIDVYVSDGSTESAADKAINRWVNSDPPLLLRSGSSGIYRVPDHIELPPGPPSVWEIQYFEDDLEDEGGWDD